MTVLSQPCSLLDAAVAPEVRGRVQEVRGLTVHVTTLPAPVGAEVHLIPRRSSATKPSSPVVAQIVGFGHDHTVVMPLGAMTGIGPGDTAILQHLVQSVPTGANLLGRVVDALGRPIDRLGPIRDTQPRPLDPRPLDPLDRPVIDQPLATGVRAIDAMLTLGKGQRIGVFSPPGVGKSTLLGSIVKNTAADVCVIGLVGERGREVRAFLENTLGPEALARSVVVAATGDDPAMLRLRAAKTATAIAEGFRDEGLDVLLIMDSVTRFAQAQRQVGLAAGEPPATRGYPPSVFSALPELLERSGRTAQGSITGVYSVLIEGNDFDEPIADACRGVLDGHILLSRELAEQGHFPAIDVLTSVSRVAEDVTTVQHQAARRMVTRLLADFREVEDLLQIGAYAAGSNASSDVAIACKPAIDTLLRQGRKDKPLDLPSVSAQLAALAQHAEQAREQVARATAPGASITRR